MLCSRCGTEINDGMKFCSKCGMQLEIASVEQKSVVARDESGNTRELEELQREAEVVANPRLKPRKKKNSLMRMFFSLQGRATRSEWWRVDFILSFGAFALAMFGPWLLGVGLAGVCLSVLWAGLIWVGLICVAVRRLHDIGISGWFVLLIEGWFLTCLFTGIVGGLLGLIIANLPAVIVLGMKAGTPGPNKYGERPKVAPEVIPTKANVQPKKIVVHRTTMKIKKKPQAST